FPLNHKQLKFHVDSLLRARLGDNFPKGGVGKNWTDRSDHRCHDALREAYELEDYYKGTLYGMQSTAVLQEMYCQCKRRLTYAKPELGRLEAPGPHSRIANTHSR
ncbi:hypothetical protein DFH29DRAFT_805429, partial [Suillus ampliporus]